MPSLDVVQAKEEFFRQHEITAGEASTRHPNLDGPAVQFPILTVADVGSDLEMPIDDTNVHAERLITPGEGENNGERSAVVSAIVRLEDSKTLSPILSLHSYLTALFRPMSDRGRN